MSGGLWVALVLGAASCIPREKADVRSARDETIGRAETAAWRFEAEEGLLHVTAAADDALEARASASAFRFRLERKRPDVAAVRVTLWNLTADTQLLAAAGVLEGGEATPGPRGHARTWTVRFPAGADAVDVEAPPPPVRDFTLIAMGDIQRAADRFGDVVDVVNLEPEADAVLLLGDLSQTATEGQFDVVDAQLARLKFPVWATPGNHDVIRSREYQERYGRASYSIVHRGVRLTSLDSADGHLDARIWDALDGWLAQGAGGVHVVFSHIPAVETLGMRGAQWNSPREAYTFLTRAAEGGVDVLFFGHVHTYDAYSLAGIPTYISGGCGAIPERMDGIGRHFLRVRVSPTRGTVDITVVRVD